MKMVSLSAGDVVDTRFVFRGVTHPEGEVPKI
jgi:hypothetical protein